MDDLTMVREAYGEIEPDPRLQQRIRARLALEAQTGGAVVARARPRWGRRAVGLGAAAAVAVALTVTVTGTDAPGVDKGLSARTILLAAAERSAAEPEGRFRRVHVVESRPAPVDGAEPYTVLVSSELDSWLPRKPDGTATKFQRTLPARPLTSRDRQAWERAGSPTSFVRRDGRWVPGDDPAGAGWQEQRTTPEDGDRAVQRICAQDPDPEGCEQRAAKARAEAPARAAERARTAADPSRFEELLFPPGTENRGAADKLRRGVTFLLYEAPSAEVRAATFRLLADLPGVTASHGDGGIAITAEGELEGITYTYTMVLDPTTYRLKGGSEVVKDGSFRGLGPGTPLAQLVVKSAGWTDEEPHHD
ncbi:hypothetical protein AB0K18_04690 [Nonomuraea sp. NPDC049421]|uniref:hypothetical protein n=1 Tax=Nonomuraea sp. NPDC049421 TaxID=3155275 RepID=UPI0034223677